MFASWGTNNWRNQCSPTCQRVRAFQSYGTFETQLHLQMIDSWKSSHQQMSSGPNPCDIALLNKMNKAPHHSFLWPEKRRYKVRSLWNCEAWICPDWYLVVFVGPFPRWYISPTVCSAREHWTCASKRVGIFMDFWRCNTSNNKNGTLKLDLMRFLFANQNPISKIVPLIFFA